MRSRIVRRREMPPRQEWAPAAARYTLDVLAERDPGPPPAWMAPALASMLMSSLVIGFEVGGLGGQAADEAARAQLAELAEGNY